jgi:hypothetical protein
MGPSARTSALRRPRPLLVLAGSGLLLLGILIGRATAAAPPPPLAEAERAAPAASEVWTVPGPTRVEAGAPVGFALTPAGAVAAAASYVTVLSGERMLVADERVSALTAIAAGDAAGELIQAVTPGMEIVVEGLGLTPEVVDDPGFVARSVPAGYRLDAYTDDEATVHVWHTSMIYAEGRHAVAGAWGTEVVRLRWEREDWRLVAFSSEEGPTPPSSAASAVPDVGLAINSFAWFSHGPYPE